MSHPTMLRSAPSADDALSGTMALKLDFDAARPHRCSELGHTPSAFAAECRLPRSAIRARLLQQSGSLVLGPSASSPSSAPCTTPYDAGSHNVTTVHGEHAPIVRGPCSAPRRIVHCSEMRNVVLFLMLQGCVTQSAATSSGLDSRAIGEIVGVEPTTNSSGIVRVSRMRDDVAVTIEGMPLAPEAGLTSWAAFMPTNNGAMVMGDTVVFEDEANAAMDAAFAHGLEITALHNHFFFDRPPAFFMHVGGHGEVLSLAKGIRAMWDAIADVRRSRPQPGLLDDRSVAVGEMDAAALAKVLGSEGKISGPTIKFSWGREARMHGVPFSGTMGLSTWAAFSGSDAFAAVDGDFAMTAVEVQPVLQALRRGNIHVVALHNHMIGETPAYYFVHYWAKGPALALARSLRRALDAQRNAR